MFNILYSKQKQKETVINNQGFALLGILITVFIIAAIAYGVFNTTKKETGDNQGLNNVDTVTTQGQLEALNDARGNINNINQTIKEQQQKIDNN
jgi:competence protein ComGC